MITPKEKAKELVDRMYRVHSGTASEITLYTSKECALIAVEELIKYMPGATDREFWEQVKQEIEIL
jgi:hypothetical protein